LAYVVLSGATVTITSLLSDLLMIKLDPRIKLGGKI
jgi:ABC-type dipeptide/oligopeptide/nickel transport system permease component